MILICLAETWVVPNLAALGQIHWHVVVGLMQERCGVTTDLTRCLREGPRAAGTDWRIVVMAASKIGVAIERE